MPFGRLIFVVCHGISDYLSTATLYEAFDFQAFENSRYNGISVFSPDIGSNQGSVFSNRT
jgi:hypothetical protein